MTIHHAVAKKALKSGVTFTEANGGYIATHTETGTKADANSATDALDLVLKAVKANTPKATRAPKAATKKAKKIKKKPRRKSSDEDEDGEDEEGAEPKSVVKAKYKKLYRPHKDTNGDDFAQALHEAICPDGEGVDLGAFNKVCTVNSIDPVKIKKWMKLKNRHGAVNTGMMRMNLGNVLRGMIRRDEMVKLGSKSFKGSLSSLKALPKAAPKD